MNATRRCFLAGVGSLAAGGGVSGLLASGCRSLGIADDASPNSTVRLGIVSDLHYADIDSRPESALSAAGGRYFRESRRKLAEAVAVFNARKLDFAIELGDFKDDSGGRERTIKCLEAIESEFAKFSGPRYHVAGNHDFDCITPDEFFSRVPNDGMISSSGYYSFECGGVKFVVLDACFDSFMQHYDCANPWDDSNVPTWELEWFGNELAAAKGSVIVFCHQRLDDLAEPRHKVRNAAEVRALMERSGKVKGVFTGHQHVGGGCTVNGITYHTLRAAVCDSGEGANSFAEVAVYHSGAFSVTEWHTASAITGEIM